MPTRLLLKLLVIVQLSVITSCGDVTSSSQQVEQVEQVEQSTAMPSVSGATMGTSWSATWTDTSVASDAVELAITQELSRFNQLMSTWDPASELSQFNQSPSIEPVSLHSDTLHVIDIARRLSSITQGRYDITLAPVIALWGFDGKQTPVTPDQGAIDAALAISGARQLVRVGNTVRKRHGDVSVDVSSLAKGYAVDKLGEVLESLELHNYLVEIGGEIRVRGSRLDNSAWRIGIENPDGQISDGLLLNDGHVASSGSYRNYRSENGKRLSHIIDGATGKPITHNLVAVTVVHDSTILADAWATALMVVGESKAQELINAYSLTVRLVVHAAGEFKIIQTPAFAKLLIGGSS